MPNPVLTMEAANLFCGAAPSDVNASNHLLLTELKLPGLDEQYVDHRPGGSPIAIEIDTIIARLESTFVLMGWAPQVAELVGSWQQNQNQFYAYGVVRDRMTGEATQSMAIMKGRLGRADPQNWRRGDVMHWNYAIRSITHYELYLAGEQIYYWDFFNNIRVVGGVDMNADINALLATGSIVSPATLAAPGIIQPTGGATPGG